MKNLHGDRPDGERARIVIEISPESKVSAFADELTAPVNWMLAIKAGDEFYVDLNGERHIFSYRSEILTQRTDVAPPTATDSENAEVSMKK